MLAKKDTELLAGLIVIAFEPKPTLKTSKVFVALFPIRHFAKVVFKKDIKD